MLPFAIVGCGPAGLAAADVIRRVGGGPFVALESGEALAERDRRRPADAASGVGGAGLFSDGKFSFYPAASALWRLPRRDRLRAAYGWLLEHLAAVSPDTDAPGYLAPGAGPMRLDDDAFFKDYPSIYVGLEARRALIDRLYAPIASRVQLRATCEDLAPAPDGAVALTIRSGGRTERLRARGVLLAGGRFMPLLQRRFALPIPTQFRRVEVGLRVEGPATHPLFAALRDGRQGADPKLIIQDPAGLRAWRTFCFCARGEVVETEICGLVTLSGRADCAPTDRSNVGFNLRSRRPADAEGLAERLRGCAPFCLTGRAVLSPDSPLDRAYGPALAAGLRRGLAELARRVPALWAPDAPPLRFLGPTLEGVGDYPALDPDGRVPGWPIYAAGDCGGRSRGLVAALVGGAYVGGLIAQPPKEPAP